MTDSDTHAVAPERPPLRIAAVVAQDTVPAWIRRVLEDCMSNSACYLAGAFVATPVDSTTSPAKGVFPRSLYERLDARLFPADPDAFARVCLPSGIRVQRGDMIFTSDRTELGPATVASLLAEQVDVVVGLGVPRLEGVSSTDISVWTLEIGGRPLASWTEGSAPELVAGKHLIVITLRETGSAPRLPGEIRRTVTSVVPWSTNLTRNKAAWSAANMVGHALCHAQLRVPFPKSANLPLDSSDSVQADRSRTSAVAFPFRQIMGLTTHALVRSVARDEWHVAYRVRRDGQLGFDEGGGYRILPAPPGHSYADPLLIEHGNRHWLFMEDLVYAKGRARIVCVELGENTAKIEATPVLDKPHHLSYPFVFKRGSDIFMVPESGETNSIELFRAVSFPDRWEGLGAILSGLWGSDATLIEHGGMLWMFLTVARRGMHPSDELHLYYAADLLGPWESHRMNPIVTDVRAGRGAGRIFSQDGVLIRPAQDSARRYGHAINFQALKVLSEDDYQEETVGRLDPRQLHAAATHTYNFDQRYEVVDCLRPRARWHR